MTIIEQNIQAATKAADAMEDDLLNNVYSSDELLVKSKQLSEMIGTANFLLKIKAVNDSKSKIVKLN